MDRRSGVSPLLGPQAGKPESHEAAPRRCAEEKRQPCARSRVRGPQRNHSCRSVGKDKPLVAFTKLNGFVENLAEKVFNLGSDQLVVALSNTAPASEATPPSGATSAYKHANVTQISYTNCSSRNLTTSSSTQSSGTYALVLADLVLSATGTVGPFRYIYLYDDTATNDELIGYYDYGSSITLASGAKFTLGFGASANTLAKVSNHDHDRRSLARTLSVTDFQARGNRRAVAPCMGRTQFSCSRRYCPDDHAGTRTRSSVARADQGGPSRTISYRTGTRDGGPRVGRPDRLTHGPDLLSVQPKQ